MPISDIRLTLSTQVIQVDPIAIQVNPIEAGARLVGQAASDALTQAARVATVPIARALVLNVTRALGGGGAIRQVTAYSAAPIQAGVGTTPTVMERQGGGLIGTIQSVVVDGVVTAVRLVPATIDAGLGVAVSTINAVVQTGLAGARAVMDVGAAALTLNPAAVVNAAALGAVRIAGTIEQTTIGVPDLTFNSPQPAAKISEPALRTRTPSIVTSILNGRQKIADAISPSAVERQALTVGAIRTASKTIAGTDPQDTTISVVKTAAKLTSTDNSTANSTSNEGKTAAATAGPKDAQK